jgi:signal recognition particle subunit SRP54
MAMMSGKGGGMPDPSQMDPAALEAASKQMGAMKGLPGLGGGMGGLGGFPGMGRKK